MIGEESFQYCILDTEKNTFIALADYRLPVAPESPEIFYAQLGRLIAEEARLLKSYPSVVIGIDTPWHTLVPSALFETDQAGKYLGFNFRLPADCKVQSERIPEIDAFHIYGFHPGLMEIIRQYYRDAAIFHRSTALIKAIYHHQANADPSGIFLNVRDQFIDIIKFGSNKPVFFNSFPCRSKEDVLYFTLYTIEQLKLRPDSVQLAVCGMMDAGSDLYLLLERYIRTVTFTGRINSLNYSPLLNQAPLHRYTELFALALCGS